MNNLVDLQTLLYGALIGLGTLVGMKLIDVVLGALLDKAIFTKAWHWLAKNFKKQITRFRPIRLRYQFSARIESTQIVKAKGNLDLLSESIAKKQQMDFTPTSWTQDDIGSSRIVYNGRQFHLNMTINHCYLEPNLDFGDTECLSTQALATQGIYFCLETEFPYHELDKMLLGLGSLLNLIKDELKDCFLVMQFSKGMFTVEPLKQQLTIDEWVKKKQFEVSLVLKSNDKVTVNLLPKKLEVLFPLAQIDDKVSEYLREVILNYYF